MPHIFKCKQTTLKSLTGLDWMNKPQLSISMIQPLISKIKLCLLGSSWCKMQRKLDSVDCPNTNQHPHPTPQAKGLPLWQKVGKRSTAPTAAEIRAFIWMTWVPFPKGYQMYQIREHSCASVRCVNSKTNTCSLCGSARSCALRSPVLCALPVRCREGKGVPALMFQRAWLRLSLQRATLSPEKII